MSLYITNLITVFVNLLVYNKRFVYNSCGREMLGIS